MAEINLPSAPKEVNRREFLRWGKAAAGGVAAGIITHKVPDIINSSEYTNESHMIEEARRALLTRLHLSDGVMNVTGDHIAHNVRPAAALMGETRGYQLMTRLSDVNDTPPEGIFYANGAEYVLSRARMGELYESIRIPKLVIATDGDVSFSKAYIEADAKSVSSVQDLMMRTYYFAPLGSYIGTLLAMAPEAKNPLDAKITRRTLLKIIGIGAAGAGASRLVQKNILPQLDLTDLSTFPPVWQKLIRLLPFRESVQLRNKIMTANMNALGNVPLYMMTHEAHVFAGGGHREIAQEILREPKDVREDLHQFLVGKGREKGILYKLFDLYHASGKEDKAIVLDHAISMLESLFGPVAIRVNYKNKRDDLGAFSSMQRMRAMGASGEQVESSDSAFVILARSFQEIHDRLKAGTDPFLRDESAQDALQFYQNAVTNIYAGARSGTMYINDDEHYAIGDPVVFQPDQAQFDLFDYRITMERGFVTKAENMREPPGKG